MSATILSFRPARAAAPALGLAERALAAAWAARLTGLGRGHWRVETHLDDDGVTWLGIVTPSSRGVREEDRSLSWLLACDTGAFALTRMPSGRVCGTYRNILLALEAIEAAEARPGLRGSRPTVRRRAVQPPGRPAAILVAIPAAEAFACAVVACRAQITLDHSAGTSR